jgi:hypothetical protein
MIRKTEALGKFLQAYARSDLASLYNPNMEVQVNAAQDRGVLQTGVTAEGKHWQTWTNPDNPLEPSWKSFRIPLHANTEPVFNDSDIKWCMEDHVEGIGLTGWDFKNRVSKWVAFDFDAISGHSDKHLQKLSDENLQKVQELACQLPWVTVRKSTSGNGLHLYVFLNDVPTANHTEHAALARAILCQMSALTGFDFNAAVDNCGSVMWIWHRKYIKSEGKGLELIKEGIPLDKVPENWREHVTVTGGVGKRTIPGFIEEKKVDAFEDLCGQHPRVPLDEQHRKVIDFLNETGSMFWWDADHHMLVCHTWDLKQAHAKLELIGLFETNAKGSEHGIDQNCFAFPMRRGAWTVRRHTRSVQEDPSWELDTAGWTKTYLNREPTLQSAAKTFKGIEDGEKQEFVFRKASEAAETIAVLGNSVKIPEDLKNRETVLKQLKDGRVVMRIKKESGDDQFGSEGWLDKEKYWVKCLRTNQQVGDDSGNYDDMCRHLISESCQDSGWVIKAGKKWVHEPPKHISLGLVALNVNVKEVMAVMGNCVVKNWTLVNQPFQPEYPGDRQWNKEGAQLAIVPNPDVDGLHYPTWSGLLNHCGRNLDSEISRNEWCKANNILTGGDYLKVWIASMFQQPFEPLPYLFLYGEQGSGKSILHEAISMLMTKGVVRADCALTSTGSFNGELEGAVLGVIEETDLSGQKTTAYNRIKDWTTGRTINIHRKGITPYTARNSLKFIQCSNDGESFPSFPGDTRVTMIRVDCHPNPIPKRELIGYLQKEASDFLASVLNMALPVSEDARLNLPIIKTEEKKEFEELNANEFEMFLKDCAHHVPGEMILVSEMHDAFRKWLPADKRGIWSKPRMVKNLPKPFVKGKYAKEAGKHYIGNISWELIATTKPELIVVDDKIVYKEADV